MKHWAVFHPDFKRDFSFHFAVGMLSKQGLSLSLRQTNYKNLGGVFRFNTSNLKSAPWSLPATMP
jgi:hypothetical protein